MKNIAVLASGSGTNAENLVRHFEQSERAAVKLILSNNPTAFVLERAKKLSVSHHVFNRHDLYHSGRVNELLASNKIDLIILAGFLWLIPESLLSQYPGRIINIHPALLPKYGGKGMYGSRVHQAVIDNAESKSGITIHLIDHEYDKGQVLKQVSCDVLPDDTADTLASRIHALEYTHYPSAIEDYLENW